MNRSDGWDWPFIIYAGTVWLKRTEEEVWCLTPRKLHALLLVHYEVHGNKADKNNNVTNGFIDDIPGW